MLSLVKKEAFLVEVTRFSGLFPYPASLERLNVVRCLGRPYSGENIVEGPLEMNHIIDGGLLMFF